MNLDNEYIKNQRESIKSLMFTKKGKFSKKLSKKNRNIINFILFETFNRIIEDNPDYYEQCCKKSWEKYINNFADIKDIALGDANVLESEE